MSYKSDPEALANVPTPSGSQEALFLRDTPAGWHSKTSAGTAYALAGVTSVGASGTTPNANAATVTGAVLNLQTGNATFAGLMSAVNYGNVNNYFGRMLYNVEDYGVLPGNTAAANVTAMNTLLQTTATEGAIIQFGPFTYSFNAGLTTLTKDFCFRGIYGQTTIAITADMGSGVPFLKFLNTGFYTSVMDLNFVNFATQTTNYIIMGQNNANPQFINCFFTGASNWSGILDFTGSTAGNGAVIKNLYVSQFTGKCINVVSPLSTMYIEDTLVIGGLVANSIGFYCSDGGAALLSNCQFIGCDVNVKLDPANGKTVSAIFAVNCFFDQGKTNCMLITGAGTGTVARCHFIGSWFTISTSGSNTKCIQITTAGSGIHAGIQFQDCEIMNATAGSTGTLIGLEATAVQDITISNSQFAGWTTDVNLTPASAGTLKPLLIGNTFATWGLIAGSTNNVTLNAGSFTYGNVTITGNDFGGTGTRISDSSAITITSQKVISCNSGLMSGTRLPPMSSAGAAYLANSGRGAVTSGTAKTFLMTFRIPAGAVVAGQAFRLTVWSVTSGAGVPTWEVALGANGTTADTTNLAVIQAAQAANVRQKFEADVQIPTIGGSGTGVVNGFAMGGITAAGVWVGETVAAEVVATVVTTSAWFITLSATCGTTGTITVQQALMEAI